RCSWRNVEARKKTCSDEFFARSRLDRDSECCVESGWVAHAFDSGEHRLPAASLSFSAACRKAHCTFLSLRFSLALEVVGKLGRQQAGSLCFPDNAGPVR